MNDRWGALARTLGLYGLAVAIGAISAWGMLRSGSRFGAGVGPWRASILAGSPEADIYTRARVALGGLLALDRSEAMYYVATTDSAGAPLRSRCTYRIRGRPPNARWWSVTAYADDFFLFANEQRRYSFNGSRATLDPEGRFTLVTSPAPPTGSGGAVWLPTPGDRGIVLALRLYDPAPSLAAAPATLDPPAIVVQGECR